MRKKKILFIFGTRPEAIKLYPLIKTLNKDFRLIICSTAQHTSMLQQVLSLFKINVDFNLKIMKKNQDLFHITSNALTKIKLVIRKTKPDLVLVQGDTTSAFVGALSAFYYQIPVAHVEAGLRTNNLYSPFPEELNRQFISKISKFNFCPTNLSRINLKNENIKKNIFVTGNTVVDCIKILESKIDTYKFKNIRIKKIYDDKNKKFLNKVILITLHRRENLKSNINNIVKAIKKLSNLYKEFLFVFPIHKNPKLREIVLDNLKDKTNILITEPLDYLENLKIIKNSYFIISDSGGIQEEAPYFGTPLILTREDTERPEGIKSLNSILVGGDKNKILYFSKKLINDIKFYKKYSSRRFPYGDGNASKRILNILKKYL